MLEMVQNKLMISDAKTMDSKLLLYLDGQEKHYLRERIMYNKVLIWLPAWLEIRNLIMKSLVLLSRMLNEWFSMVNHIYKQIIFQWCPTFGTSEKICLNWGTFGTFFQFLTVTVNLTQNRCLRFLYATLIGVQIS